MTIIRVMTINAVIMIALGIGFTLYGPNMLAFFRIIEVLEQLPGESGVLSLAYWNIVSFGRMFGIGLFSYGLLIWAVRGTVTDPNLSTGTTRGIVYALLISNALMVFTSITQQVSVWSGFAGWVIILIFATFTIVYLYFLLKISR